MQESLQFLAYWDKTHFLPGCVPDRSDKVLGKILETFWSCFLPPPQKKKNHFKHLISAHFFTPFLFKKKRYETKKKVIKTGISEGRLLKFASRVQRVVLFPLVSQQEIRAENGRDFLKAMFCSAPQMKKNKIKSSELRDWRFETMGILLFSSGKCHGQISNCFCYSLSWTHGCKEVQWHSVTVLSQDTWTCHRM